MFFAVWTESTEAPSILPDEDSLGLYPKSSNMNLYPQIFVQYKKCLVI